MAHAQQATPVQRGIRMHTRVAATPPPAWWLPGPHLPTIAARMLRRVPLPATTRVRIPTGDGDTLAIERIEGAAGAPRLIVFHGLEGGLHSAYARGLLHAARARKWWADLVLWRTCDGTLVNDAPRTYHSGASDDADTALKYIVSDDPSRACVLVGVSLGGNVMLKWMGERAASVMPNVRGAVAVSVPYDLAAASRQLERGFSSVYGRFFLKSLKRKALAKLERFPGLADRDAVRRARTLWEFDDAMTAPAHGFVDAADYYRQSSSLQFLLDVRVPTVLLNARNDPFLPDSVLDRVSEAAVRNEYIRCVFPAGGGHVGFVAGTFPWRARYWMEGSVLDWLSGAIDSAIKEP